MYFISTEPFDSGLLSEYINPFDGSVITSVGNSKFAIINLYLFIYKYTFIKKLKKKGSPLREP
jgi:hypothetical protein